MTEVKDESPDMENGEEGFISRWSRRKIESGAAPAEDTAATPPEVAGEDAGAVAESEKVLTDEDMPPLEELGDDSDYSGFLSAGVSENLRQAALRKLFRSAKFNVCDGLDDYAEDYTKFLPLGDVITADMRHHAERALRKLAAEKEAEETAPALQQETAAGGADPDEPETVADDDGADAGDTEDGDDASRI